MGKKELNSGRQKRNPGKGETTICVATVSRIEWDEGPMAPCRPPGVCTGEGLSPSSPGGRLSKAQVPTGLQVMSTGMQLPKADGTQAQAPRHLSAALGRGPETGEQPH